MDSIIDRCYLGRNHFVSCSFSVHCNVVSISLRLDQDKAEFLCLKSISFRKGGKLVIIAESDIAELSQSSIWEDSVDLGPQGALNGSGIHTGLDRRPFWKLSLKHAIEIDEIVVENRSDIYASRANSLVCAVVNSNGEEQILRWQLPGHLLVDMVRETVGIDLANRIEQGTNSESVRDEIGRLFAASILAGQSRTDVQTLDCFRRLISPTSRDELLVWEYVVIAHDCFRDPDVSRFRFFQSRLKSRKSLEKLQCHLELICLVYNTENRQISRHGTRRSIGFSSQDQAINALKIVLREMESAGFDVAICYGTLLGAVRGNGLIPYDDDVDILYFSKASSDEEFNRERDVIIRHLIAQGISVLPMEFDHIKCVHNGVDVDLFPCRFVEDRASLVMEKMRWREIEAKLVKPVKKLACMGGEFPVPADPKGFLAERYGEGWMSSDPWYEWLWTLDGRA